MRKNPNVMKRAKNTKVPFTIVHNQIIYDKRLSWQAKGLMSYFLSRPDGWTFYTSEITKHTRSGRIATNTAIKELLAIGYLQREQKRINGQFTHYEYTLNAFPQPSTAIRFPACGKRASIKTNLTNTEAIISLTPDELSRIESKRIAYLEWLDILKEQTGAIN